MKQLTKMVVVASLVLMVALFAQTADAFLADQLTTLLSSPQSPVSSLDGFPLVPAGLPAVPITTLSGDVVWENAPGGLLIDATATLTFSASILQTNIILLEAKHISSLSIPTITLTWNGAEYRQVTKVREFFGTTFVVVEIPITLRADLSPVLKLKVANLIQATVLNCPVRATPRIYVFGGVPTDFNTLGGLLGLVAAVLDLLRDVIAALGGFLNTTPGQIYSVLGSSDVSYSGSLALCYQTPTTPGEPTNPNTGNPNPRRPRTFLEAIQATVIAQPSTISLGSTGVPGVCLAGYHWKQTKRCEKNCAIGQYLQKQTNTCSPLPVCSATWWFNAATERCEMYCGRDQVWNPATSQCATVVPAILCQLGARYSTTLSRCVPIQCQLGQSYNLSTSRCEVIQCPQSTVFSPTSNNCETLRCEIGSQYSPATQSCTPITCPGDQSLNPLTNTCQQSCPQGQVLNPQTSTCVVPTVGCDFGLYFDPITAQCKSIVCPAGYYQPPSETMVTTPCSRIVCGQGSIYSSLTGECEMVTCPGTNEVFNPRTLQCELNPPQCPVGQVLNYATLTCQQVICPLGSAYSFATRVCPIVTCDPTHSLYSLSTQQCEYAIDCPSGQVYSYPSKQCEALICPPTTVLDPETSLCYQIPTCPANQVFSFRLNRCIPTAPTTPCAIPLTAGSSMCCDANSTPQSDALLHSFCCLNPAFLFSNNGGTCQPLSVSTPASCPALTVWYPLVQACLAFPSGGAGLPLFCPVGTVYNVFTLVCSTLPQPSVPTTPTPQSYGLVPGLLNAILGPNPPSEGVVGQLVNFLVGPNQSGGIVGGVLDSLLNTDPTSQTDGLLGTLLNSLGTSLNDLKLLGRAESSGPAMVTMAKRIKATKAARGSNSSKKHFFTLSPEATAEVGTETKVTTRERNRTKLIKLTRVDRLALDLINFNKTKVVKTQLLGGLLNSVGGILDGVGGLLDGLINGLSATLTGTLNALNLGPTVNNLITTAVGNGLNESLISGLLTSITPILPTAQRQSLITQIFTVTQGQTGLSIGGLLSTLTNLVGSLTDIRVQVQGAVGVDAYPNLVSELLQLVTSNLLDPLALDSLLSNNNLLLLPTNVLGSVLDLLGGDGLDLDILNTILGDTGLLNKLLALPSPSPTTEPNFILSILDGLTSGDLNLPLLDQLLGNNQLLALPGNLVSSLLDDVLGGLLNLDGLTTLLNTNDLLSLPVDLIQSLLGQLTAGNLDLANLTSLLGTLNLPLLPPDLLTNLLTNLNLGELSLGSLTDILNSVNLMTLLSPLSDGTLLSLNVVDALLGTNSILQLPVDLLDSVLSSLLSGTSLDTLVDLLNTNNLLSLPTSLITTLLDGSILGNGLDLSGLVDLLDEVTGLLLPDGLLDRLLSSALPVDTITGLLQALTNTSPPSTSSLANLLNGVLTTTLTDLFGDQDPITGGLVEGLLQALLGGGGGTSPSLSHLLTSLQGNLGVVSTLLDALLAQNGLVQTLLCQVGQVLNIFTYECVPLGSVNPPIQYPFLCPTGQVYDIFTSTCRPTPDLQALFASYGTAYLPFICYEPRYYYSVFDNRCLYLPLTIPSWPLPLYPLNPTNPIPPLPPLLPPVSPLNPQLPPPLLPPVIPTDPTDPNNPQLPVDADLHFSCLASPILLSYDQVLACCTASASFASSHPQYCCQSPTRLTDYGAVCGLSNTASTLLYPTFESFLSLPVSINPPNPAIYISQHCCSGSASRNNDLCCVNDDFTPFDQQQCCGDSAWVSFTGNHGLCCTEARLPSYTAAQNAAQDALCCNQVKAPCPDSGCESVVTEWEAWYEERCEDPPVGPCPPTPCVPTDPNNPCPPDQPACAGTCVYDRGDSAEYNFKQCCTSDDFNCVKKGFTSLIPGDNQSVKALDCCTNAANEVLKCDADASDYLHWDIIKSKCCLAVSFDLLASNSSNGNNSLLLTAIGPIVNACLTKKA